ncbi:BaiN/RdsA family NAD(P)/FAD-dependent oxidoreductase [Limnohabitans parvus]|uniref:Aminoacetone oxidase family FAD-binding enzyme n=1 Tax=Limnohabitans parvus II-B4 TaxID=1293052 RepID=A0A315FHR0_9BURK|nr:NAD(P)/FAD-dependent oxidoreductase [Limnohabitans parvus]PUE52657.1 aminoacetone oxidase family FAD-binding enzyme [Limnohabitans parvus II-B4]
MNTWDVVIVGAGAAGLFCAGVAGQRGLKVLVIDHSDKVAEKIRISGGGRCNFTNRLLDASAPQKHFISQNPHFCRSALSRYTPQDFIDLVQKHGIAFHEKHKGQLFCDHSAEDIIRMLLTECEAGRVTLWTGCSVKSVRHHTQGAQTTHYVLETDKGPVQATSLVVATGGLSIPKIGATGWGYEVATQFGLRLIERRPGLVPLTFDGAAWAPYAQLAGLALPVGIETGEKKARMHFDEDLLFTHRGLSGPGVLQISSYWQDGTAIRLNLAPEVNLPERLQDAKLRSKKLLGNELASLVPSRLAEAWVSQDPALQRTAAEVPDKALNKLAQALSSWTLTPTGSEGYKKAEVTLGGVDTRDLSSQTMESKQPGLYFIGEVVDVTGWLGGYNFQWAWASAHACAQALPAPIKS